MDPNGWLVLAMKHWQQGQPGDEALKEALAAGVEATKAREAAIASAQLSLGQALLLAGLDQQGLQLQKEGRELASALGTGWEPWEVVRKHACDALAMGHWKLAQELVVDWVAGPSCEVPANVDDQVWCELLLNACSAEDERLPDWWLVESRSLPRSGHHFLKRVLEKAWGEEFSYCESYQEPGCCKTSPCRVKAHWHFARRHNKRHLRLLKSHDFQLTDTTFKPPDRMVRLIQIRRPFDLLVSWLELQQLEYNRNVLESANLSVNRIYLYHEPELLEEAWQVIDNSGRVMNNQETKEWLTTKTEYIIAFLQKWLPNAKPFPFNGEVVKSGNYILPYEQLSNWDKVLDAFSSPKDRVQDISFRPKRVINKRRCQKATRLIGDNKEAISAAEAKVVERLANLKGPYKATLQEHCDEWQQ